MLDRLEKIKWLVNNPNPCSKCSMSSYYCDCLNHFRWKEMFDELNIDYTTEEEANSVREVFCLKKDLEKHMQNISEEVKKEFML